jgi:O-antigen/teichoic acid export membrane protein
VSDTRAGSFLAKAGPLVLARFFTAGLTVCIPLVLARALSLPDFGTYKQLFLLSQTLYYVLPLGVPQSLFFFLPRTEERRPWMGQTLLLMSGVGVLTAALIYALTGRLAAAFDNPSLAEHALALAVFTASMVGSSGLETALTARGRTRAAALVYLVSDVVRALILVVPVLLGFGLQVMMLGVALYGLVRWAAAWWLGLKGERGPLFHGALLKQQLRYAAPFGAAMLLAIPQQYAHQYAVGLAVPTALFAIYTVGCFQLPLVDLLYSPTSEVLMVRLGELDREGRVREGVAAFREASGRLAYAFLPLAAFLFAAAPEFIGAAFGAKFLPAVPLFRVSVLGVVLAILPMDGVLRARGETRAIFLSYLVKALVTVPLVWVGVTRYGMMGGIVSWALAEVVGKLALFVRLPSALSGGGAPVPVRELMPWPELGRAAMAAGAAAAAVALLRTLLPHLWEGLPEGLLRRGLPLAAVGLLFGVGYLALLRVVGVRPLAVLASLRRRPG